MRIQPWITGVTCAAMLFAAQSPTMGQTPFDGGSSGYGTQYPPSSGYDGYAAAPQDYQYQPFSGGVNSADPASLYPAGVPENFNPWPQISPFDPANVAQTQHYNRDGLWYKQMLYRRRDYQATVSGIAVQFRDAGNSTIGASFAQTGNAGAQGVPIGTPANGNPAGLPLVSGFNPELNGFYILTNRIFPFPLLSTTPGTLVDQPIDSLYPIHRAGALGSAPMAPGLQGELAFFNEDDTGVKVTGWGAFQTNSNFQRGYDEINGIPLNQTLVNYYGGGIITPMNGNIPLYTGEPLPGAPAFGSGSTAKYDVYYGLTTKQSAGGSNISIYRQPLYKEGNVMLRPLWGARYLYINESFGFKGIDSGFNYPLPEMGGDDDPTLPDGGYHPSTPDLVRLYSMYTATLNNKIQSHVAGPEIGLRFDLGDQHEGFKLYGESILGLAVNNQRIQMNGNQIGDPLADVRVRGHLVPRMLDEDSRFNNTSNSTHVSPMFQQSIYADFDIIEVIPGLRNMAVLDNSTLRFGYTVNWVGLVSRPTDTIKWQGFPLYPEIDKKYSNWWAQQLTASLNFNF
ncbi:hypothetical protein SH668x_003352 [Planctomicrobium sp. SH668]|uniref:hypothetical protein n=1 Tax=Planctomicrobium sp. SH668 TaxID=3448126 RepID=UPI003F5B5278